MKPTLIMHSTKVLANMDRLKQRTPHASGMAMSRACEMLRGYIVKRKLSGQVLKRRTGRLAGSIDKEVTTKKDETIGRVGSNLKYAKIHEIGGVIPAHTIYPVKASVLHFYMNGQEVFCKSADIPEIKMKARHYISSSMKEYRNDLQRILGRTFWTEVTSG